MDSDWIIIVWHLLPRFYLATAPYNCMQVGFKYQRIELVLLALYLTTDGHDAHVGDGVKLVSSTRLDMGEVVFVAMLDGVV